MFVEYNVGTRYRQPDEEPPMDAAALFMESIPIYKLWYAAPVDVERELLAGQCTHIGLLPPDRFPDGMPLFFFGGASSHSLLVRAPLIATQEQVEGWAVNDSNMFMFVLIERGTQVIQRLRMIGVAQTFRRALAKAWLSVKHPVDMQELQSILTSMNDQSIIEAAALWTYNATTDQFEQQRKRPQKLTRSGFELDGNARLPLQ
jgi:hypothetical protein